MKTIHHIYEDYESAAKVVADLEAAGYTEGEVTLLGRQQSFTAESGAKLGAVVGSGTGLLAGLGVVAFPGIGPLVAAGWLLPTLAGGAVGAITGGLLGTLTDSGVPEADAHVYAEVLRRDGALVILRVPDELAGKAHEILARHATIDTAAQRHKLQSEGWKRFEDRAR